MLRPWVSFIALGLILLLIWELGPHVQAWIGGALLLTALLWPWLSGRRRATKRAQSFDRAKELDWSIIDNSLARDRLKRDCERPETLGQCTGRDCMVYDTCDFNIKKPLP